MTTLSRKILIVDDEPLVRDTLCMSLKNEFDVFTVASGDKAIEAVQNEIYPVVILDLRMPGLSGIETLKMLLKLDSEQKVIILTAHGSADSAISALNQGAYNFMTKPCRLNTLRKVASEAYELYFQEKERAQRQNKLQIDMHDNYFSLLQNEFNTSLNSIIDSASQLSTELEDKSQFSQAQNIENNGKELLEAFVEITEFINWSANHSSNTTSKLFMLDNLIEALTSYCQNVNRTIEINLISGFGSREFSGHHITLLYILQKIAAIGVDINETLKIKFWFLNDDSDEPEHLIADLENTGLETLIEMDKDSLFTNDLSDNGSHTIMDLKLPSCQKLAELTGVDIRSYMDSNCKIKLQLKMPVGHTY